MTDQRTRSTGNVGIVRHGRLPRSHPMLAILKIVAATLAVVLVSGASVGAYAVWRLSSNIETVDLATDPGDEPMTEPPALGKYSGGFDILIAGSDECDPPGTCEGENRDEVLNDVTMLLHVAEDQQSAVLVSFPRDLIIPIPACPREAEEGGGNYAAMSAQQINVTLTYGGLPCTVKTVEALTGMTIPYAGLIKFQGVVAMSTAVGGVDVCIDGPIEDSGSKLNIPAAGVYNLEGDRALQFLRTRKSVGDGSDLGRISSQQVFLSALVRKIKDDSTLTDPAKLYGLASAATENMILSSSLSPNTMVSMALVLKDIPLENIVMVQYPSGASSYDPNRVVPISSQADELFAAIESDTLFVPEKTGNGSTVVGGSSAPATPTETPTTDPSAPVDPSAPATSPSAPAGPEVISGLSGQTAAQETCSVANN